MVGHQTKTERRGRIARHNRGDIGTDIDDPCVPLRLWPGPQARRDHQATSVSSADGALGSKLRQSVGQIASGLREGTSASTLKYQARGCAVCEQAPLVISHSPFG